jgi:tetrahydromethanopterin S-methyltransferase subunit C
MAQQTATKAPVRKPVGTGSVFLSFAPWIIFGVVASPSTWEYAALAALIASIVLSGQDLLRGRLRLLDVTGIVFFAVLSVLGLAVVRGQLLWVETYAQVISNGLVAVVALGSLLADPFTAQYARESSPREVWDSPVFRHINRVLTTMWGAAFALMTVSTWLAIRFPSQDDWFNWVVPIALLVGAVKFTQRYPERYKARVL